MPNLLADATLLAFDFGTRYIGVAVGQTTTCSAQPLTTLQTHTQHAPWQEISQLITNWQPQALVVGIPLNMNGSEQPITLAAREFAAQLKQRYGLPVYTVDERLTSVQARAELFAEGGYRALNKQAIDSKAAQVILESWLSQQVTGKN